MRRGGGPPVDQAQLALARDRARQKHETALEEVAAQLRKEGTASEADIEKILANLRARGSAGSAAVHGAQVKLQTSRRERFGVGLEGADAAESRRKLRNARKRERRN